MSKKEASAVKRRQLQPVELMGHFWNALGAVVLVATIFVRDSADTSRHRGVVVNLAAALIFLGVGSICVIRGRRANKENSAHQI
jgi:uncharacterized membrane protein